MSSQRTCLQSLLKDTGPCQHLDFRLDVLPRYPDFRPSGLWANKCRHCVYSNLSQKQKEKQSQGNSRDPDNWSKQTAPANSAAPIPRLSPTAQREVGAVVGRQTDRHMLPSSLWEKCRKGHQGKVQRRRRKFTCYSRPRGQPNPPGHSVLVVCSWPPWVHPRHRVMHPSVSVFTGKPPFWESQQNRAPRTILI